MGFALSKWPHLHRAYIVTVPEYFSQSVYSREATRILTKRKKVNGALPNQFRVKKGSFNDFISRVMK